MGLIALEKPRLLLVEGKDDQNLFEALAHHLALHELQVLDFAGKTNLARNLRLLRASPGWSNVESLGIVRDADDSAPRAFESVSGALRSVGLAVPSAPMQRADGTPCVVVMIVPDNRRAGMLEDVCLESVKEDPAMPCVEELFACLAARNVPAPQAFSKAKVSAFLASRPDTVTRLGEAAFKHYWAFDSHAFALTRDFLRRVCP